MNSNTLWLSFITSQKTLRSKESRKDVSKTSERRNSYLADTGG